MIYGEKYRETKDEQQFSTEISFKAEMWQISGSSLPFTEGFTKLLLLTLHNLAIGEKIRFWTGAGDS